MENDELNQLIKAARGAAFFIKSVDGYENSKIANQLLTLADKVERQKLLAIGRLAARVVYRNSKKAVEQSVQADGAPQWWRIVIQNIKVFLFGWWSRKQPRR